MVTKPVQVRRTSWRSLRQDALSAYAENVLDKTNGQPPYQPLHALLTTLSNLHKTYNECLAKAMGRDRAAVAYKDEIKSQLYNALDEVATGLEMNAKGEEMYVLNAGMEIHKRRTSHTGTLLPPEELTARSNGLTGQAQLNFKCPRQQRRQVETFAVEWRTTGQAEWKNGTYRNAKRIVINGLPERTDVEFRVRCLGTRGRKSDWSEVATAFVV